MNTEDYYSAIPAHRAERLKQLETWIVGTGIPAKRSLRYKMPTFESADGWIAIGNQKHFCAVYTCSPEKIGHYTRKHTEISHGKGCLRFKDSSTIDRSALLAVIHASLSPQTKTAS